MTEDSHDNEHVVGRVVPLPEHKYVFEQDRHTPGLVMFPPEPSPCEATPIHYSFEAFGSIVSTKGFMKRIGDDFVDLKFMKGKYVVIYEVEDV